MRKTKTVLPCVIFTASAAALMQGCAIVELDPFGRAYAGENLLPAGMEICASADVDTPVKLVRGNHPAYPVNSVLNFKAGTVKLGFRVDEAGKITVLSAESEQSKYFATHAKIAISDWKVTPAMKNGVAVPIECEYTYDFGLRGHTPLDYVEPSELRKASKP